MKQNKCKLKFTHNISQSDYERQTGNTGKVSSIRRMNQYTTVTIEIQDWNQSLCSSENEVHSA